MVHLPFLSQLLSQKAELEPALQIGWQQDAKRAWE